MMESFANINFSKDELMTTMSIIVSVLFLGNINFDTSTLTDKDPLSI
jgi:FtsH-binding integral membrane protein